MATIGAYAMVEIHGVRNLGWMAEAHLGNRPSLDMEKKTRDWPSSMTSMTVPSPKTAPILTSSDPQLTPVHRCPAPPVRPRPALVVHQAGEDGGNQNVEDGADHQRTKNADGHILLRILGLLGRGGDGVKADVGKEDRGRAERNAVQAEVAVPVGRRNEWDASYAWQARDAEEEIAAKHDENADDRQLDNHDCRVQVGRFLDADDQHVVMASNRQHGHQVEEPGGVLQPGGEIPAAARPSGSHWPDRRPVACRKSA
jgi:hypothetical protein